VQYLCRLQEQQFNGFTSLPGKKIADALIDGHPLRIEGGDFRICDGQSSSCSFGGCYKQEIYQKYAVEKGEGIMRIAVTY